MSDTGTNHATDTSSRDEAPAERPNASSEPTLIEGAAAGPARTVESPAPPADLPAAHAEPLLCEGCGYSIDGLAESVLCPECGMLVCSSLPARRRGSRWERSHKPEALKLVRRAMRHKPDSVFRSLRFSEEAAHELIANTIWHVTAWTVFGLTLPPNLLLILGIPPAGLLFAPLLLMIVMGVAFVVLGVAEVGIELAILAWARAMGWRASRRVVRSVAAHAYGSMPRFAPLWFAAGLSPWLFLAVVPFVAQAWPVFAMMIFPPLLIAGPPVVLAHKRLLRGVYVCRFANVPGQALPAPVAPVVREGVRGADTRSVPPGLTTEHRV